MKIDPFVYDCPRHDCGAKSMTFDCVDVVEGGMDPDFSARQRFSVFGVCRACRGGVVIDTTPCQENNSFMSCGRDYLMSLRCFPTPEIREVSDLLPQPVRQVLQEAEQALGAVSPRIARGCFRTVLDVATQYILQDNPESTAARKSDKPMNLSTRLDFLAGQHLLNPTLKEWAHDVRAITNDDIHTVEPVSNADAQEIAEITRLIVDYLFVMPERVRLSKEAADAKKEAAKA